MVLGLAWLHHLDTDSPSVTSFQLKWDQQLLVLSCSGLKEAAEASTGGAHVRTKEGGPAPVQLKHGIERSGERGRLRGGGQGQTRIEPPASATRAQGEDKRGRIVTLTVPTLSLVDALLTESQKWDSDTLINRQILMDEGPWRGADMTIAWELYFQAQGLAPAARCGQVGCTPKQPHVVLAKVDGDEKQQQPRRKLTGFCDDCWQHVCLRHGRDEVPDMSFPLRRRSVQKKQEN